ncbi:MAG: hypothetical protein EA417_01810 [Gammaproteobacteria bacterium]|nr:MAG: hypothetical protein EA417_01810 [Gammaproteobacteria bacterium]
MTVTVRAGDLRHRVRLERRIDGYDESGSREETWQKIGTRWAQVRPMSQRALIAAREAGLKLTHEVEVRYPAPMSGVDRIVFRGRTLYPEGPPMDVDEARVKIVYRCEERVDP